MQDLLRAHSTFLLHHAASLSALFVRSKRSKFVAILSRYWDLFLSTWDVMLHGNPACAVFGGIKMAACGELGVGVGEEERGSGEREVLEGFIGRVEGLVDLVVSKFGDVNLEKSDDGKSEHSQDAKWLGLGEEPGAEDGAIFLGVGALSRHSLRDLTYWMEDLYTWGEDAYGVKDSPTSTRGKRTRVKSVGNKHGPTTTQTPERPAPGASDQAKDQASESNETGAADDGGKNKFMHYLKMGYGKHWSLGGSGAGGSEEVAPDPGVISDEPTKDRPTLSPRRSSRTTVGDNTGHYLIGLQGDVEETGSDLAETSGDELESRTLVRTLTVELESEAHDRAEADTACDLGSGDKELMMPRSGFKDATNPKSHFDSQDRNKTKKMRVVVYVSRPFIYTFLFQNRTDSLAWDALYRSLHYQLEPLRKPLILSTMYRPDKPDVGAVASHIFDLVWDPKSLTVHSTIPCIPDPVTLLRQSKNNQQPTWSRAEALSTHMQILNTYAATRGDYIELERTCKTNRGWWVVWTRILDVAPSPSADDSGRPPLSTEDSEDSFESRSRWSTASPLSVDPSEQTTTSSRTAKPGDVGGDNRAARRRRDKRLLVSKEIFLIRRAGEGGPRGRGTLQVESGGGWADGASRLAQGIGVDTRKYIDGLLSLGR